MIQGIDDNLYDIHTKVPAEVLCNPALLFLYYRVEQILGIKAGSQALIKLNEYLEKKCHGTFIENPAAYEYLLTSREHIYDISKFLTINETYFFREGAHFELLTTLLPEFAKLCRPVQICSAAVSIGCEAYSIAMFLDYYIKNGLNFDYFIDAFDVNEEVIETAKNARYTSNTIRGDSSAWKFILDSYLIHDNEELIVSHDIRRKVRFFPHNIMRGLEKQYDIIFFRNALIYFSSRNRLTVINSLAESLYNNGVLFLGISETASIKHPLLCNKYSNGVFYFQRTALANTTEKPDLKRINAHYNNEINKTLTGKTITDRRESFESNIMERNTTPSFTELPVNCCEITEILNDDDGKLNARNVYETLSNGDFESLSGGSIAACVVYYLHTQDFDKTNFVLTFLEKFNTEAFTLFLRGEYYFLNGHTEEAEKYYHEAAVKNKFFWPAFYRIATLSADGNPVRYEYKIRKAIESIEQSLDKQHDKELNFECFMGGFSQDYFHRILEKKLTEKQEATNGYKEY